MIITGNDTGSLHENVLTALIDGGGGAAAADNILIGSLLYLWAVRSTGRNNRHRNALIRCEHMTDQYR